MGAPGDLSALYWLTVLSIPFIINKGLFKRKRAREKQVMKLKGHKIRKQNRHRAQLPHLCSLAMLGLYPLQILLSCSGVSTAHLAHGRNILVPSLLRNYLYLFSRDQRRGGGFLRLTWGKVVNEKSNQAYGHLFLALALGTLGFPV